VTTSDAGWTLEALREHLQALAAAADRRYEQRFDAQEKAVDAALTAANQRLNVMNEFRGALTDQAATFATRIEVDQRLATNDEKLSAVVGRLDRIEGRTSGISSGWGVLLGVVGIAAFVMPLVLLLVK